MIHPVLRIFRCLMRGFRSFVHLDHSSLHTAYTPLLEQREIRSGDDAEQPT